MDKDIAISVKNIKKSFKIYFDKGNTLKERSIFSSRRKYEKREVLKDISFDIKKGETVALIGHNGCGKSTTLKLLTRIMYPDSGEILIDGRVSSLIELGAGFHPDMSGRENIYINASIFGLTKAEIDSKLNDIIEFSELRDYIDNPVRTYSSGMYMRLAFAVAINVNAEVLLVDEILSVGDANYQAKCYERMRELKASGVTIVIVTHDLATVKSFCDRAFWINKGEIVEEGEANTVVDKYLAYMNAERLGLINEKGEIIEVPEYDEDGEEITMDTDAIRFGNRKAVITSCQLLSPQNIPVEAIRADDPFKMKITYRIKDDSLDELVFGMGIYTLEKVWIFATNTKIENTKINVKGKKEGTIIFEAEPLHLLTNRYILQCSIEEPTGTPCDFYNEYLKFNVINDSQEVGIISYDVTWKEE